MYTARFKTGLGQSTYPGQMGHTFSLGQALIFSNIAVTNNTIDCSIRDYQFIIVNVNLGHHLGS